MTEEFASAAKRLVALSSGDAAVILIGSAARGKRSDQSDIDFLFVAPEKVAALPVISGYHIKFSTEADFLRRLQAGEDFEAWCARLGTPLVDRGVWARIQAEAIDVWPRWETKVVHGIRRLFLASQQFQLGDRMAAREELVFVLGHISRGLLLKDGTFPLSRPELADQVRTLGYPHLATMHERLRLAELPSRSDITIAIRYSKKLLVHLDRGIYGKVAKEYANVSRAKESRLARLKASRNGH